MTGSLHRRSAHHWGSHLGWCLTGLLLEKVSGSFDLLVEFSIVLEVALDVFVRQVNEHTSDLRSELASLELSDEVKDGVSNLLLHVRVGGNNGGHELEGVSVEQLFGSLGLLATHASLRSDLAFRSGHSSTHDHTTVAVSIHRVASVLVVVRHVAVLGSSSTVVTGVVVVAWATHLLSLLHLSTIESTSLVLGEVLQELNELVLELILGGDVVPLSLLVVHFLKSLEAHLILALFVSDLTEFLEFVVADLQLTLVNVLVVEFLESRLGLVGGLEADEGVGFLCLVDWEHLDALNLTLTV